MNFAPLILIVLAGCAVSSPPSSQPLASGDSFAQLVLPAPRAATVHLEWNAEEGVAGYGLYYGSAPRSYTHLVAVSTNVCTLAGLPVNARYYFAVTAVTSDGTESDFSEEFSEGVWCFQMGALPGMQVEASPDLWNWSACEGCQFLGTNADQSLNWSAPIPEQPQYFYRLTATIP